MTARDAVCAGFKEVGQETKIGIFMAWFPQGNVDDAQREMGDPDDLPVVGLTRCRLVVDRLHCAHFYLYVTP